MPVDRLPTALWLEGHLRRLNAEGRGHYILHKGEYASGLVLIKINALDGTCRLLQQQRNFMTNTLEWAPALEREDIDEAGADEYIARATARDPDLWVIEVEDKEKNNPFEI